MKYSSKDLNCILKNLNAKLRNAKNENINKVLETDVENRIKHIAQSAVDFEEMPEEEQQLAEEELIENYGYNPIWKNKIIQDLPMSKINTMLSLRIRQQIVIKNMITFPELAYQTITMAPNGMFEFNYTDTRQGKSIYNMEGNTEANLPYSPTTIDDLNGEGGKAYREIYNANVDYSNKYKIISDIFNDVTLSPAIYGALVKDGYQLQTLPLNTFYYQRFIHFMNEMEFDKGVIKPNGYYLDAENSENRLQLLTELKTVLKNLNFPSRGHINRKVDGNKQPLLYSASGKGLTLFINTKLRAQLDVELYSQAFSPEFLKLSNVSQVIEFNDETWKEWYPKASDDTPILFIMTDGIYREWEFYKASKAVDTPKLYSLLTQYVRIGHTLLKNGIAYYVTELPKASTDNKSLILRRAVEQFSEVKDLISFK